MAYSVRHIPQKYNYWEPVIHQDITEFLNHDEINPLSGFEARDGGSLKFLIQGNENFIDLEESYIRLVLKLTGKGVSGTGSSATDVSIKYSDLPNSGLTVVNNIAHSIFRWVRVKLGNTNISLGDGDYPYKVYQQLLTNTNRDSQDTYFGVTGWERDIAEFFDEQIGKDATDQTKPFCKNRSAVDRRKFYFDHDDGVGEFYMKPHIGLCFLKNNIPPYLDIEFELSRHDTPNFYLKTKLSNNNFRIQIIDAKYFVKRLRASVRYVSDMEKMFAEHPIVWRINEGHVTTCTIPSSVSNYVNDNLFHGNVPRRIAIALVGTENYNGDWKKNPFNFEHFNVTNIRLLKNGLEYPHPETITDFKNQPEKSMDAYHRMMTSFGSDYSDHVVPIKRFDYARGYTFFSFFMAPDQDFGSTVKGANKPSQIRVELRFDGATAKAIQMIVFYESETTVTIDHLRRVVVEHQ